ncbi:styrene monooxygenase/indole monooxygenase family protein [Streptomyces sp. NPDC052396]|uniref:styrene monooxygenase/indole monooxygenase family protein n=1 Tax=Streptomyces sp. NPDC052396 TaxID=3365689 RepID=UPI0037D20B59
MRRIAIVGAGQAGLQLALGLRTLAPDDYEVLVVSARRPAEIRAGRVQSTQQMFEPALALERALGLGLWDAVAPRITGAELVTADPPGTRALTVTGTLRAPAQSVDLRLKTARWLELFEERGGRVEYRSLTAGELPALAAAQDLTLVATGRGPLGELFGRDKRHSPYDGPRRTLAVVYLHGVAPQPRLPGHLRLIATPGAGELFLIPGLTLSGPCDMLLWEAVPGGPLDRWHQLATPEAVLARSLELMRHHAPWEYERCAGAEPTDAGASLVGAVTPVVRHPVAEVAPGSHVLGLADAVVLNDPLAGQGCNTAAHCADHTLRRILDRGERPFDRAWQQQTFAGWWEERARHSTAFTNLLLDGAPEHMRQTLRAAAGHPEIAHRYVNGFADPADYREWLLEPERAAAYLAAVTGRPPGP